MEPIAIIDFETTGLSPDNGARTTEVAAVIIQNGKVVSRYQSLMNAGIRVPAFVADLTGITNAMVQKAPSARQVMQELCEFLGSLPLISHYASFDEKFFENECRLAGITHESIFVCSLLVARRLFPEAPNYKLGALVNYLDIQKSGEFHRVLLDAELTAQLVVQIQRKISLDYSITFPTHAMLRELQHTNYADVDKTLKGFAENPPSKLGIEASKALPKEFIRSDLNEEKLPTRSSLPSQPQPVDKE